MENMILSHPSVQAAVIVGEYQFSPSLLIDLANDHPRANDTEQPEAMKRILAERWRGKSNRFWFFKDHQVSHNFYNTRKAILACWKGGGTEADDCAVIFRGTCSSVSSQQNDLLIEGLTLDSLGSPEKVEVFTKQIYSQTLEIKDLHTAEDVFQHWMDSLKVLLVVQRFRAAVETIETSESGGHQYSIDMPGAVCREDVCRTSRAVNKTEAIGERASILREQRMKSLLEKYMFRSPSSAPPNGQARSVQTVILTGTTGSLGNYVLAALESMPRSAVSKI